MSKQRWCCAILFGLLATSLFAQQPGNGAQKYWVFFKDKNPAGLAKMSTAMREARANISARALRRRNKVQPRDQLIDKYDLPVGQDYLSTLESLGHRPVVISRWLNAVSIWLRDSEKEAIQALPFVRKVQLVGKSVLRPKPEARQMAPPEVLEKPAANTFDYGQSFTQNELVRVPEVHDLGITGSGVLIGMLDTGFKFRDHEVFARMRILGEFDFIHNDDVTENEAGQDVPEQHVHGTETLSVIGGFKEGKLIGPAFDASFLLAKTEIFEKEIPQEEDFWMAGIEWLENQGVDVVSSSLGYLDFYTTADMDGNTAVSTLAGDIAVSKGVVVVNSAGNEGRPGNPWQIIIAPADGDSVIAVGAVTPDGSRSDFSSLGPTADGRIKPDVAAMGSEVIGAFPSSDKMPSPFTVIFGTSFSCPMVAGVAALILSAHPNLTPLEVRDALRLTASQASNPDNLLGWGVINAYDAVLFHGTAFSNMPEVSVNSNRSVDISIKVASRFGIDPNSVILFYRKSSDNIQNETLMTQGSEKNQFVATIPEIGAGEVLRFYFAATDSNNTTSFHPFMAPDSTFLLTDAVLKVPGGSSPPSSFVLRQNYPNPFNPSTTIEYDLPVTSKVSLVVYNLLGQRVRTLVLQTTQSAGMHKAVWDGTDDNGRLVAGGIYFYRLKANDYSSVKRLLIVR